eukprot:scaffold23889_cov56-Phaeocystis_antarctica.AAC.2
MAAAPASASTGSSAADARSAAAPASASTGGSAAGARSAAVAASASTSVLSHLHDLSTLAVMLERTRSTHCELVPDTAVGPRDGKRGREFFC